VKFSYASNTFRSAAFAADSLVGFASALPSVELHVVRIGDVTAVTAETTLSNVVWYCWYLDGAYVGKTSGPTKSFRLDSGEQLRLDVIATDDEDFDPIANAPDGYPSRRTLWWIRSIAIDAASYRVDQCEGMGDWTTLAIVPHDATRWHYAIITGRLKDMTEYTWRIVVLDASGNEAESFMIGPEMIVRTPDAPNFIAEYDSDTGQVTFDAVAVEESEDIFT